MIRAWHVGEGARDTGTWPASSAGKVQVEYPSKDSQMTGWRSRSWRLKAFADARQVAAKALVTSASAGCHDSNWVVEDAKDEVQDEVTDYDQGREVGWDESW